MNTTNINSVNQYIQKNVLDKKLTILNVAKENYQYCISQRNVDFIKIINLPNEGVSEIINYNCYPKVIATKEDCRQISPILKKLNYNFFQIENSGYCLAQREISLNELINHYINHPDDEYNKFWLGLAYEKIGHASSAMGYYLSCAENSKDDILVYESLLRLALGYEMIGGRSAHLKNALQLAVSVLPNRPEGYWLMTQHYYTANETQNEDKWAQMYVWACMGKNIAKKFDEPSLLSDVKYDGDYIMDFQKNVAAWWMGKFSEATDGFKKLKNIPGINNHYKNLIEQNLEELLNQKV